MSHPSHPTPDENLRPAMPGCFAGDERTASANLRVGVLNGIVHQAGAVQSREARIAAVELAGSAPGYSGRPGSRRASGCDPGRTTSAA